ncbi:DUF3040 domain-containing protein [Streptomyces sp. NPDC048415]|jgi:hypothetical protein|uniref:DUF3040 domain-containing protein n=1 Tax=Streptomyces sp. NPDC048415 TaxID=3154822 RepID=UPI00341CFEB6
MDSTTRLSLRERLILKHIETELRRDRRLQRTLRAPGRDPWLPTAVTLLGVASAFLMVVGIRTSDPAVIWAFAALWPLTLLQAFRLLCRWSKPRDIR